MFLDKGILPLTSLNKFHIFVKNIDLVLGVEASHLKNKMKTSSKKSRSMKLESLVHSSYSYAVFYHKLEN